MAVRMPIGRFVSEWHKSRSDNRSPEDLLLWLIRAFWAGELAVYPPNGLRSTSREIFLDGLREYSRDSGIVFSETPLAEEIPPGDERAFEVDLSTFVVLPADLGSCTSEELNRAYAILANEPAVDDYPRQFLIAFATHELDRGEFIKVCESKKWEPPSSWLSPVRKKRPVYDDPGFRAWLSTEAREPKKYDKGEYFRKAHRQFKIPRHRFDKAWEDLVPAAWKRRGVRFRKTGR